MWQTKEASAVPKNLGLGFNFRLCSEGDFLTGHPLGQSINQKWKFCKVAQLFFFVSVSLVRGKFEGIREFIIRKIQTYVLFRSVRLPICMCNFRCRRLELRLDLSWEKQRFIIVAKHKGVMKVSSKNY